MLIFKRIVDKYNEEIMSKTDCFVSFSLEEYEKYKKLGDEAINNLPISFIPSEIKADDVCSVYNEIALEGCTLLKNDHFSLDTSGEV